MTASRDANTGNIRSVQERGTMPARVYILAIILWIVAIAVAFSLDSAIASWVYKSGLYTAVRWSRAWQTVKVAGTFYFSICIGVILLIARGYGFKSAVLVWISGIIAGLYYALAKWVLGRSRPIHDLNIFNARPFSFDIFHGGLRGLLISQSNLSFPSGHSCVAFATASALAIVIPRWRFAFFGVAIAVVVQRVLEGSHYLSDTIAGAGLGVLAALTAMSLLRRFDDRQSLNSNPKSR